MRNSCLALCISALSALVGCAGPALPVSATLHNAADAANRRAVETFERGDFAAALAQAQQAYDLAASVEYDDGLSASRMNLSMIQARLGHAAQARAMVDAMLQPQSRTPPAWRAKAALRRAVLALDDDEPVRAAQLVELADASCLQPCALAGKLAVVRAQVALAQGRLPEALALAQAAIQTNRHAKDDVETANALRLWGNAALFAGRAADGQAPLSEALEIDKRLALSRKVFRDLLLLGLVAHAMGDADQAMSYWHRAQDAARGDGNVAGVAEVNKLVEQLTRKGGNK